MWQVYKFMFVIVLILSVNFFAWMLVRVFYKQSIPLHAIGRNSIMGICAASIGFWGVDVFKWLFYI